MDKKIIIEKLMEIIELSKQNFGEYKIEQIGFTVHSIDANPKGCVIYNYTDLKKFVDPTGNLKISKTDLSNLSTFIKREDLSIYNCIDNYTSIHKVYKEIKGWKKTLIQIFDETINNQNTR